MAYTTINKSSAYMDTCIWDGNNSTSDRNITTGVNGADLVWTKRRDNAYPHMLFDSVRTFAGDKGLSSQDDSAEGSVAAAANGYIGGTGDSFITLKEGSGDIAYTNANGGGYTAWSWKAGTTSGITTNGSSTITPTGYSFNATSGFSIIEYDGNNTAGAGLPHGLGVAPSMVIVKRVGSSGSWIVYHKDLGGTKNLILDAGNAFATESSFWNNTAPDATNIYFGTSGATNVSGSYIAYCFAEKIGYCKVKSYTGNSNADGTFVYCGFKPTWVLIKNSTDSSNNWHIYDNKRLGYNPDNNMQRANIADEDKTDDDIDLLSNGFKLRRNSGAFNTGHTYVYLAIGQTMVGTNNTPATAR
tara:strand:- start:728 stop:1798 length:1071 start_codon:yes stop_codon:yes gene_type:complete